MSDWVEGTATPPRVTEWVHVPTRVVLFVREFDDGYGVCIRATPEGSVDRVSIGDPETGLFRRFDDREAAVEWAAEWKESDVVLKALAAADTAADDSDSS